MKRVEPSADFDVQVTLELARVAREPSLADKQRVLEALQVRLGDMPSLPSAGESTTGVRLVVPKLNYASVVARVARSARSLVTSKAAMHLVWVGAATGGFGFWLGALVNDPTPDEASRTGAMIALPGGSVPVAEVRAPVEQPSNANPSNRSGVEPAHDTPSSVTPDIVIADIVTPSLAPPKRAADVKPSSTRAAAPVGSIPRAPRAASAEPTGRMQPRTAGASAPPVLDPNARFLEAVRLLSRAQRALDGGEPALTLVLLGELDERVPRELLSEEREATLVIALCKNGELDRARSVATELAVHSPSSIYAARIARSCGSFGEAVNSQTRPRTADPRDPRTESE